MFKKQSIYKSFLNALCGLIATIKEERNMQIAIACIPPVMLYGFYAGLSRVEFAVIIICIFAVILSELANTAIEHTIDAVITGYSEKAKAAKDTAAAITLMASVMAAVCGVTLLLRADALYGFFTNPVIATVLVVYLILVIIFFYKNRRKK